MNYYKVILFLILLNIALFSQSVDNYINSFDSLYALASNNMSSNPDTSGYYASQAFSLADEIEDDYRIAEALILLADVSLIKNDNNQAELYLLEAVDHVKKINDNDRLAKVYLDLGNIYENAGDYDTALNQYKKAFELHKLTNDYKNQANALNRIGVAYKFQGNYPEALKWHYQSLRLSEENKYLEGEANALGNIANVNESLDEYEEALEIYSRILEIFSELNDSEKYANTLMNMGVIYFYTGRYEEALIKFKKSFNIAEKLSNKLIVSYTLNNIACTYEALNNYRETFNYFNKALEVARNLDNKWGIANTLNNMAATNIKLNEDDKAYDYVTEALSIAEKIGAKDLIAESYKILSDVYMNYEDYKNALLNFKLYKEINDSLYNEKSNKQIAEINTKYETEKKEKAIQELQIQQQSRIIVFISITLLLILIIAFINYVQYRYKKKSAQLLKSIIDSLTHPFCVFTVPSRELDLSNIAAEDELSPYKQIINDPGNSGSDSEIPFTFGNVVENKKPYTVEKLLKINGSEIYYEFYGFPVFDKKNNVSKVIEYAVDITEEKLAIEQIKTAFEREKELNDLKSQFISSTSHEFRTPLATLFSSVELIQHYDKTSSENKKLYHISRIKGIVKYMTRMLDDILTINRAEANRLEFKPTNINLRDFCNEIMEDIVVLATSQHYINHVIEGDFNNVYMDAKLLRHILTNLLSNAIKYSPSGGQIVFKTRVEEDEVTFTVRDEGIGIPKHDLKNLFQHFFRASNVGAISGAGLGLAIVKKAVTVHGGTLKYESKVGQGTTFIVNLPLKREMEPSLLG